MNDFIFILVSETQHCNSSIQLYFSAYIQTIFQSPFHPETYEGLL